MAFCSLSYVENFRLIQCPNIILKWIGRGAKRRGSKIFLYTYGIVSIAEKVRLIAEKLKLIAEKLRKITEKLRMITEKLRLIAEKLRLIAEKLRKNSENDY